ncbi:conserved hypothetical protein [Aspergillus fumigatus A1163]|uniref:Uncharacterized protein n=1 Tax=Aspergillus fumigatus (strain CBS 144.89 / FGSC A1163 / CEA10) TaxID=451804 RepID=B0XSD6_ASPFC|nr:conserved hypothetical protein [Aspergillus fumigatus A1163]
MRSKLVPLGVITGSCMISKIPSSTRNTLPRGTATYPLLDIPVGRNAERVPDVLNIFFRIRTERLLILHKPRLPDLSLVQFRLQLRKLPVEIGLDQRLHRRQGIIHLPQPGSLLRSPDLLLGPQDRLGQILRLRALGRQTCPVGINSHFLNRRACIVFHACPFLQPYPDLLGHDRGTGENHA